jgi:S-adenosylmethionine decarboxylase
MLAGMEWIIDAHACRRSQIAAIEPVRAVCERLVIELGLRVVGEPHWHQFPPPGGVTGLYLLTESHLACHTFPEWGLATFNLYCCNPRPDWPWEVRLADLLGAEQVTIRQVARGGSVSVPEDAARLQDVLSLGDAWEGRR